MWAYLTFPRKVYSGETSKSKTCLIFSLAGARGAVTLASIISIPAILSNGSAFPHREMIILLATGVILSSLFLTNFILPLMVRKDSAQDKSTKENLARLEILNNVVTDLGKRITKANRHAMSLILKQYRNRIEALQNSESDKFSRTCKHKWQAQALQWEMENTDNLLKNGDINEETAGYYKDFIEQRKKRTYNPAQLLMRFLSGLKFSKNFKNTNAYARQHHQIINLKKQNDEYVIGKFKQILEKDDNPVVQSLLTTYELSTQLIKVMRRLPPQSKGISVEKLMGEIASIGFQSERDQIQTMYEQGRLSWETAKELRNNITLLETQMV